MEEGGGRGGAGVGGANSDSDCSVGGSEDLRLRLLPGLDTASRQ